jgi:uncharacterized protein (TIGR02679 family)
VTEAPDELPSSRARPATLTQGATSASRLETVLGGAALAWLRRRIVERLARGAALTGTVTLASPNVDERSAIERLFGRITKSRALRVDLEELGELLRCAELAQDLAAAVVQLEGPVENRRQRNEETTERWRVVLAEARTISAGDWTSRRWLEEIEKTGLLRRLAGGDPDEGRALLSVTFEVLRRLPATAAPLAELAATVAGDSHTLDGGAPIGTLVLRAIADRAGLPPPADADDRRSAWAFVGVLADELSAPALLLNLPTRATNATGRALALAAEVGEPYRLSTRQLLRDPPELALTGETTIFICENPSVVAAAADRLGPRASPLLCTEGQPRTAIRLLLARLREAGATLKYHGDFDWPGIQIANGLVTRFGVVGWRFGVADYLAAPGGNPLTGTAVTSAWDPDLTEAMIERGRGVHEEAVLSTLVDDLSAPGRTVI